MDKEINVKDFLSVFEAIRSQGKKENNEYRVGELVASHDYDGYTCWLNYRDVSVTLMFHSGLKIKKDSEKNYSNFLKECFSLLNSYNK
ncbi:MAG: hypothetical protein CL760_06980 [Chloroflexi bacterium]|nr:hypothetical protein [Chloroflexota bacterium]|tara:strand:- start:79119 stop:79382 length:264 start_codon:yes stop_codon:yes gene_type:complete